MFPAGSTKYKPDLPEKLLEHLATGRSVRQFCRDQKIGVTAFYEWEKKYPELANALIQGRQLQHAAFEDIGFANFENHKFNTNLFKFMANVMLGWTETKVVEQTTTHKLDESNVLELEEAKKAYTKDK